jgi:hypothetical protein
MNFDAYWHQLVNRVLIHHEELQGSEALFYRWSCIYGETMVDGIESYFERRFDQFDADKAALRAAGFADVAQDFDEARQAMFGSAQLDRELVELTVRRLLEESAAVQPTLRLIGRIYERMIPRLEELAEHKYEFGLREHLYSDRDGA